jgi:hypothetical protein
MSAVVARLECNDAGRAREDPDFRTAAWRKMLSNVAASGAITRLGRRHGVPTPANQAMYALLGALAPAGSPG